MTATSNGKRTNDELVKAVESGELTFEQALAIQREQFATPRTFQMKVTEKGCLGFRNVPGTSSKYGISAYVEGWEFILDHADEIRAFIAKHPELARKQRAA